ncbi:MAG: hypothetical protein JWO85_2238 [Candidatus Eremiobacteraeota bacterium]|nr:hypothetical protein [Candidatus Eremiobacteraeota bacterium]
MPRVRACRCSSDRLRTRHDALCRYVDVRIIPIAEPIAARVGRANLDQSRIFTLICVGVVTAGPLGVSNGGFVGHHVSFAAALRRLSPKARNIVSAGRRRSRGYACCGKDCDYESSREAGQSHESPALQKTGASRVPRTPCLALLAGVPDRGSLGAGDRGPKARSRGRRDRRFALDGNRTATAGPPPKKKPRGYAVSMVAPTGFEPVLPP